MSWRTSVRCGSPLSASSQAGHAAHVVIVNGDVDRSALGARLIPMKRGLDEVIAEKAAAAGDKQPAAAHGAELTRKVGADGGEIFLKKLLK